MVIQACTIVLGHILLILKTYQYWYWVGRQTMYCNIDILLSKTHWVHMCSSSFTFCGQLLGMKMYSCVSLFYVCYSLVQFQFPPIIYYRQYWVHNNQYARLQYCPSTNIQRWCHYFPLLGPRTCAWNCLWVFKVRWTELNWTELNWTVLYVVQNIKCKLVWI